MSLQNPTTSNGGPPDLTSAPESVAAAPPDQVPLSEQDVAELAYRRWADRGCPLGSPEVDWFQAECDLQSRSRG